VAAQHAAAIARGQARRALSLEARIERARTSMLRAAARHAARYERPAARAILEREIPIYDPRRVDDYEEHSQVFADRCVELEWAPARAVKLAGFDGIGKADVKAWFSLASDATTGATTRKRRPLQFASDAPGLPGKLMAWLDGFTITVGKGLYQRPARRDFVLAVLADLIFDHWPNVRRGTTAYAMAWPLVRPRFDEPTWTDEEV